MLTQVQNVNPLVHNLVNKKNNIILSPVFEIDTNWKKWIRIQVRNRIQAMDIYSMYTDFWTEEKISNNFYFFKKIFSLIFWNNFMKTRQFLLTFHFSTVQILVLKGKDLFVVFGWYFALDPDPLIRILLCIRIQKAKMLRIQWIQIPDQSLLDTNSIFVHYSVYTINS